MTIKELFEQAVEYEYITLQALIMFLVFEKQVLTMNDSIKELDLYFLPKHRKRMNSLIEKYMKKMNMKERNIYEITRGKRKYIVVADNYQKSLMEISGNWKILHKGQLFTDGSEIKKIVEFAKGKEGVIGSYEAIC